MSPPAPRHRVRLLGRTKLAPAVSLYRFGALDGSTFAWSPGQYVTLFAPAAPDLPLPYSIASAPDEAYPGEFEIAVGAGARVELLAEVAVGAELRLEGPFGRMIWPPSGATALLVGTGTGVAPLRALVQEALRGSDHHPLVLLSGHRTADDVLFAEELDRLQREHARFRHLPTLTQPGAEWTGLRGRVQEHVVALARGLLDPYVFLCGPRAMVDDCERLLSSQGELPKGRIFAEGT